jgi:hypothetical protein
VAFIDRSIEALRGSGPSSSRGRSPRSTMNQNCSSPTQGPFPISTKIYAPSHHTPTHFPIADARPPLLVRFQVQICGRTGILHLIYTLAAYRRPFPLRGPYSRISRSICGSVSTICCRF